MNIEIDDRTPIRLIGLGAAAMGCEVDYNAMSGELRFVYVGNPDQDQREGELTAANLRPEVQPIPRGPFAEAVRRAVDTELDEWWATWLPRGVSWLDTFQQSRFAISGPDEYEMYLASRRLKAGGHVSALIAEAVEIESLARRFAQ